MSDIKKDYFEEAQELARDRFDRFAASTIDTILGEQGEKLLTHLHDLKNRGIGFSYDNAPTLQRANNPEGNSVKIKLLYSNNSSGKEVNGSINISRTTAILVSFGISGADGAIDLAQDPNWGHTLAVKIAAIAIECYGVDKLPRGKPAPAPAVTG